MSQAKYYNGGVVRGASYDPTTKTSDICVVYNYGGSDFFEGVKGDYSARSGTKKLTEDMKRNFGRPTNVSIKRKAATGSSQLTARTSPRKKGFTPGGGA